MRATDSVARLSRLGLPTGSLPRVPGATYDVGRAGEGGGVGGGWGAARGGAPSHGGGAVVRAGEALVEI